MATTTTSLERESSRATCPATAVLPTRLPVPITASAGWAYGCEPDRVEPEVGAHVGNPVGESPRREPEAAAGPHDRLVGEVDDDVHVQFDQGSGKLVPERKAEVGTAAAQLLGPPEHDHADDLVGERRERVGDHIGVMLPVDEGERSHGRRVSSVSMRAVYFSYSSVSTENWMIRSCPWKGYLRQTSTCLSSISIRL